MAIPLNGHWGPAWGGDAMGSFYGQLMGSPPNGHSMEWPLMLSMGGCHGKLLWVAHGDTPMVFYG